MGTYVRTKKYWTEKEEMAVLGWVSATTEQEYFKYYYLLDTKLRFMCELIMNRYFSIPAARQNELKNDAVQHCFLNLKNYRPHKVVNNNGGYSFCSMLIKHYIYEVTVLRKKSKSVVDNNLEYLDEMPESAMPIAYAEKEQINYNEVIEFFQILEKKTEKKLKREMKANPSRTYRQTRREIRICQLCVEYVRGYNDLSPANLLDYIYAHLDEKVKRTAIAYSLRKMLKLTTMKNLLNFESTEKGGISDAKYSYIQDDVTPNQNKFQRRDRVKKNKKIIYEDYVKYSYF